MQLLKYYFIPNWGVIQFFFCLNVLKHDLIMITVFNLRSFAVLQGLLSPKVNRQEIINGKTDPYRSKQTRKEKCWINKLKKIYMYKNCSIFRFGKQTSFNGCKIWHLSTSFRCDIARQFKVSRRVMSFSLMTIKSSLWLISYLL